jgi:hypothetical protein
MRQDSAVTLKYRLEKGTSLKFSEPPDTILPSQYFGVLRGCGQLTPTERLMLAVLESAMHDFQHYRFSALDAHSCNFLPSASIILGKLKG